MPMDGKVKVTSLTKSDESSFSSRLVENKLVVVVVIFVDGSENRLAAERGSDITELDVKDKSEITR